MSSVPDREALLALITTPWLWKGALLVLLGAGVGSGIYRYSLLGPVESMAAEHPARMAQIEVEASLTNARVDSLASRLRQVESNTSVLVRAECLRLTRADQQWLGMQCPPDLYRGAPR